MFEALRDNLTTNLVTKIVSLLIAVVLWFVVLGSRNAEVSKEIPLQIVTSEKVVPANDLPDRIAFKLSGPKAFLRTILDRRESPIRVDLTRAKPGVVTYRFFADNIRVPIGVKVQSINPAKVKIRLERVRKRRVPIRIELQGVLPEGYKIVSKTVKPKNIELRGAKSRVGRVRSVPTKPIDITYLKRPTEKEVSISLPSSGVHADSVNPVVFLDVRAVTANYRMKKIKLSVKSNLRARFRPRSVTAFLRVDSAQLGKLSPGQFSAEIDLMGKKKGKYTRKVRVNIPEEVGLVKVIPEKVTVFLH